MVKRVECDIARQASSEAPVAEQMEQFEGYERWTPSELGEYLSGCGLGDYVEAVERHKITGKLATYLTDEDLKDMGINIVGDRLMFKHQVQKLRQKERQNRRAKIVWEGEDPRYWTWFDRAIETCCFLCPDDPSTYRLTTSHLKVKTVDRLRICGMKIFSCCCTSYELNNIDLTQVDDVDIYGTSPPCLSAICCASGREDVVVRYNNRQEILRLKAGEGERAQHLILNQVEENQTIMKQTYKT